MALKESNSSDLQDSVNKKHKKQEATRGLIVKLKLTSKLMQKKSRISLTSSPEKSGSLTSNP